MVDATELDELKSELRALEDRVAHLENGSPAARDAEPVRGAAEPDAFWALSGLRSRLADDPSTRDGAVMLVGTLTLPSGAPVEWQQGAGTAGLFEVEWSDRAAAFAALGHPVRMELLRHVLQGVHATAELAEIESLGTTGQLHHHLRHLLSNGWLRQSGRGRYEIPASRVVPLLACLVAVER